MQQAKGKGDGRVGRFPHPGGRLRSAGAATVAGLSVLLSGCGLTAGPGTLTPDAPSTMTVTSAAFGQGVLPQRYTCHGAKISPPLDWSGGPPGTKSYAIVVDDSSVDLITPYIRWIVFDIPQATTDIQEGQLPPGARQADNSIGQAGYDPPCPDSPGQSYRFTVYALRSTLKLANGASTLSVWTAIAKAAIARGRTSAVANP
ncbi:MAG TPA: YbhB/YbcL family Raf kinase inhibitor-like protein [Streptosporangiaceae bacterium]|jgi:Raf kinase inhibitor-like YbhB/YbcL family protein|nr:YbhB/YbcL family Raf kinase inhibitor-like protein [Streptosporangiaceae bacterium]